MLRLHWLKHVGVFSGHTTKFAWVPFGSPLNPLQKGVPSKTGAPKYMIRNEHSIGNLSTVFGRVFFFGGGTYSWHQLALWTQRQRERERERERKREPKEAIIFVLIVLNILDLVLGTKDLLAPPRLQEVG